MKAHKSNATGKNELCIVRVSAWECELPNRPKQLKIPFPIMSAMEEETVKALGKCACVYVCECMRICVCLYGGVFAEDPQDFSVCGQQCKAQSLSAHTQRRCNWLAMKGHNHTSHSS